SAAASRLWRPRRCAHDRGKTGRRPGSFRDTGPCAAERRVLPRPAGHRPPLPPQRPSLVAVGPQALFGIRPARAHLHEDLEEHLRPDHALEVEPSLTGDALDPFAALAEHDALLAVAIDQHHGT